MKKKTQKLIGLVMAVAVVASMLAGCSQKLSRSEERRVGKECRL